MKLTNETYWIDNFHFYFTNYTYHFGVLTCMKTRCYDKWRWQTMGDDSNLWMKFFVNFCWFYGLADFYETNWPNENLNFDRWAFSTHASEHAQSESFCTSVNTPPAVKAQFPLDVRKYRSQSQNVRCACFLRKSENFAKLPNFPLFTQLNINSILTNVLMHGSNKDNCERRC